MSEMALRDLIAHAVVDTSLCTELLKEDRRRVLSQFELSESERLALEGISARSLQAFAAQLEDWMRSQTYSVLKAEIST